MNEEIAREVPAMVRTELATMTPARQEEFVEEYRRKRKSVVITYLLLMVGWHYAYLGRVGLAALFFFTGGGIMLWWLVDLFRMWRYVREHNRDAAVAAMRNLKAIAA